jgi:hypothetical protein
MGKVIYYHVCISVVLFCKFDAYTGVVNTFFPPSVSCLSFPTLFLEDDLLQREAAKFVHYIIMVVMTACAKIIMSILGLDKSLSIVYALKQFLHDSR